MYGIYNVVVDVVGGEWYNGGTRQLPCRIAKKKVEWKNFAARYLHSIRCEWTIQLNLNQACQLQYFLSGFLTETSTSSEKSKTYGALINGKLIYSIVAPI